MPQYVAREGRRIGQGIRQLTHLVHHCLARNRTASESLALFEVCSPKTALLWSADYWGRGRDCVLDGMVETQVERLMLDYAEQSGIR